MYATGVRLEPAGEEAAHVANRLREHRILLGTDGPFHNVVKIRPPMPFDEANADFLVATLESVLAELALIGYSRAVRRSDTNGVLSSSTRSASSSHLRPRNTWRSNAQPPANSTRNARGEP
ncbi:MAG: hypothetical protein AB2L07_02810 [Thermoanaerobaculaceae bacterium]